MPEGSVVMIRPVPPAQLRVDDVITYRIPVEDRRIVTHRIVEIVEPGSEPVVRTQGDANNAPDPWVARLRGDQAWRVRLSVPKLGYVVAALRQPAARRLTVLAAPALFALVSVVRIWVPPKAERPRAEADEAEAPAPRQTSKKPRHQPAPRQLSEQERWREWRERRVLQRPIGRGVDNGQEAPPFERRSEDLRPSRPSGSSANRDAGKSAVDSHINGWPVGRGADDGHEAPIHGRWSQKPRHQPAPGQLSEQERWQQWRERRVLQRPVGRGFHG
jgi:signal peptidase I